MRPRRDPVLLSAHRCLTRADIERALALDVDFVEFDVQRCGDDSYVVFHDAAAEIDETLVPLAELSLADLRAAYPDVLLLPDVLDALAGRARAHLDIKFGPPGEIEATALAVERLGSDNLVVTTLDDDAVRALRDWADGAGHDLLVGLSLGRGVTGFPIWRQLKVRTSEIWPHIRYRRSRANVVVAHHWLARLGVARFARRFRLPLLVWTVDTESSLRYWMRPGRAWLVTTNDPELALRIRAAERIRP